MENKENRTYCKRIKVGHYNCNDCDASFEFIDGDDQPVCCPECGSGNVDLLFENNIGD